MVEDNIIFSIIVPKDFQKMHQEKTIDLEIADSTEENFNVTR